MSRIYLVQFSDYLEQRILGGFASEAEAAVFLEKQKREGYGWFEIFEVEVGKPFAVRSILKKFISGGREVDPGDLEDLFEGPEEGFDEGMDDYAYIDEHDQGN